MNETILHPKVAAALARFGVSYRVMECDPQYSDTAAFCERYDFPVGECANTIVVASKTDPVRYAACVVLPTTKLDVNKRVRQLMGSGKLSFASSEQTVTLTDMQVGGVVAIGLPEGVPVYVDDAVFALPEILLGGGNRSSKLVLDPQELLKLPQAQRVQGLGVGRS
jgi:prolyl-tRNA editing enzyme YbaK/EbsC (Cys-tRNA(Pro) deacylase)